MEGNNWPNRMLPKDRRFNNRRFQRPNARHSYSNQDFPYTSYADNSQVQNHWHNGGRNSYRTPYSGGNADNYSKKEDYDTGGECFKTNVFQRRRLPYDKQKSPYYRNRDSLGSQLNAPEYQPSTSSQSPPVDLLPLSPLEEKTRKLLNATKSQDGIRGLIVFIQNDKDNPISILQNAVQSLKNGVLSVIPGKQQQMYELHINGECLVEGSYVNKQAAKSGLCELALEKLKRTCFCIIKKNNYEEISTEDLNKSKTDLSAASNSNPMEGSKAQLMMLKMGWGGKGLGINEQGAEKTVAETMTQNITKEGLGGKNVMSEIMKILEEFAQSTKVTILAFDSGFTKEERALIHNLAGRLNLKSKSEGKGDERRITIGKKIARWDLVKELLLANCENETYKLIIPPDFESIWVEE